MALFHRNILGVIPARGGSKSIPGKNLKKINGISLVGHAAMFAKSLKWLDAIILSTDSKEIADEGRRYGLNVPFMRPPELSTDDATSIDMWKHAWIESESYYGLKFDISILLQPTSPMRVVEDVERTINLLIKEDAPAAITVSKTPAHYTPHKTLTVSNLGVIGFYLGEKEGSQYYIRQAIPVYYHLNGVCYAVTRNHLLDCGKIIGNGAKAVIIDRPIINIDEPFELEIANWLMSRIKH